MEAITCHSVPPSTHSNKRHQQIIVVGSFLLTSNNCFEVNYEKQNVEKKYKLISANLGTNKYCLKQN